jgi:uncharacterized repeat protein (TIGR03806 family)
VSRFTVRGQPPVVDRKSEQIIFEWPNGGHNGGCLKFGPDGMLYIVTGDGSGIADELNIGQDLTSIFAKMLRIDVNNPEGLAYGIPKDNPFSVPGPKSKERRPHPEIYAYGLRQLWRFSFDRFTGDCWGGEVGQDLWEMIYKIEKGGNYGWSVMEGTHPFRPERKKGPTPIIPPVVEHSHTDFRSVTGGFVYRGTRMKGLFGHYIYGDFDTGRVWAFKPVPQKVLPDGKKKGKPIVRYGAEDHRELARTTYRIITWAEDAEGELYFVDFTGGGIYQLVKAEKKIGAAPRSVNLSELPLSLDSKELYAEVEKLNKSLNELQGDSPESKFPRKLSQTGIFASTKDHKVAPGVIPYSVNAQLWGDYAEKERFLAIPGDGQIGFDEITYPQPSPGAPPGWKFPDGTVLVKTFSMDLERGNPKTRIRIETRLLHFQQFPGTQEYGDQYWRGYTYRWNDEQTDADLVDEKGADVKLKINVGDRFVEQNYRIPSRAECTLCHTNAAKFALGVSTMQMNRDHNYDGVIANQLATLDHIGLFAKKLPDAPAKLARLADFNDKTLPVDVRARSYLHSNCSHCHIKWGGGNAEFKLLVDLPVKDMGIVNVNAQHGTFNIKDAKLVVPGHPEQSIIHHRMTLTGLGRMPHIGSRVVDEVGAGLVRDWIKGMK